MGLNKGSSKKQAMDQIKGQIRERVSSQIWNQLNIKDISNKVNSRIGDQLTVLLWGTTKGQIKDKLWNQIRGQIRERISSQIWNQLNQISNRVKNDTEL